MTTPSRFVPEMPADQFTAEFIERVLRQYLPAQPWWRRYSNTVTTAIGGAVTLVWWLASTGWDLPHWVQVTAGVVIFIGAVFGVKKTPNGLTPSTLNTAATLLASQVVLTPPAPEPALDPDADFYGKHAKVE